jgi:hypothetical protein
MAPTVSVSPPSEMASATEGPNAPPCLAQQKRAAGTVCKL